jgi:hypothetical protein
MRVHIQVLFFLFVVMTFGGCRKYNQVDNSGTVKTPYVLYVGGYYGTLHKTNDALYFNTLFPTDNSVVRQVLTADTMLLYMKDNFYFSRDEGKAFMESNNHPRDFEDHFYKYYLPNQSLYNPIEKTVYLCTKTGLEKSTDNGVTFNAETNWAVGSAPITPRSITQLDNGNMYILKDSVDLYEKLVGGSWTKKTMATILPSNLNWFISHKHDMLLACDYNGKSGVYYSLDAGTNWTPCTGVPKNRKLLFGNEAMSVNNTFFVGLDSGGLHRLEGTTFVPSGQGIPWYAKVHFVVGKKVVYRTGVERYYHFCATDVGLYISENDGIDWRLLKTGAYSTLF